MKENFESLESLKENFEIYNDYIADYQEFIDICKEFKEEPQKNKNVEGFQQFKSYVNYMQDNINPYIKKINSKINYKNYIKLYDQFLTLLINYCLVSMCDVAVEYEKINESLMDIDHEIFPDIFESAKDNKSYQEKKVEAEANRKLVYSQYAGLYQ